MWFLVPEYPTPALCWRDRARTPSHFRYHEITPSTKPISSAQMAVPAPLSECPTIRPETEGQSGRSRSPGELPGEVPICGIGKNNLLTLVGAGLVLPQRVEKWSLTSLQQQLVKTGGRLVKHARYYWLMLAETHRNQQL